MVLGEIICPLLYRGPYLVIPFIVVTHHMEKIQHTTGGQGNMLILHMEIVTSVLFYKESYLAYTSVPDPWRGAGTG